MEDNFFRRLIDKDTLVVDQDKSNPAIFRISWFKDYHYQGEIYISLIDTKYDKPMPMYDYYHAGYGLYVNIYFTHDNRYISFDYDCNGEYIYRTYELAELFENSIV